MTHEYLKLNDALRSFVASLSSLRFESLVHSVSKAFDIMTEYSTTLPNNELAGVYLLFSDTFDLLYVGKSSLLGARMNKHFHYSGDGRTGVSVDEESKGTRYIITVGLQADYGWLAPSLEQFLIMQLKPLRNKSGNY